MDQVIGKQKKVLFLESLEGTESLFTRGLRSGAEENSWKVFVRFLRHRQGQPYSLAEVRSQIRAIEPDLICFLMDAPLHLPDLWNDSRINPIPKFSFWFDDFKRSPATLGNWITWKNWQQECQVHVFIWDGYWREEWQKQTGIRPLAIHLAANSQLLNSTAQPLYPELNNHAVFVGTIPSLQSLQNEMAGLPATFKKPFEEYCELLQKEKWPLATYTIWENIKTTLSPKIASAIDAWLVNPLQESILYRQLWRWGKRIARLRGLNAVAKESPLAILSGHKTEPFAGKEELVSELTNCKDLIFHDTTSIDFQRWSSLFRSGKFQIQITDPQSIHGGLPFRIFECAGSAAVLLSDSRPELADAFQNSTEIFLAENEEELSMRANKLLRESAAKLEKVSQAFHHHFISDHTWGKRWQEIVSSIS